MGINLKVGNYSMPSQVEINRQNIEKIKEYLDEIHLTIATYESLGVVKGGDAWVSQAIVPVRINEEGGMFIVPSENSVLPMTSNILGGAKTGYNETDITFAVKIDQDYRLYVEWNCKEVINLSIDEETEIKTLEIGCNTEIDGNLQCNNNIRSEGDIDVVGNIYKGGSEEGNIVPNINEIGNWEDIKSQCSIDTTIILSGEDNWNVKVNKKLKLLYFEIHNIQSGNVSGSMNITLPQNISALPFNSPLFNYGNVNGYSRVVVNDTHIIHINKVESQAGGYYSSGLLPIL